jgi:hypothetical protein
MNQNVQPVIPSGQTQQPSLQLSESTLFNANPSDLDFVFNEESGNFMLDFKKPQQATKSETKVTEGNVAQPDPQQQPASQYEDRFNRIEDAIFKLAGVLQGIQSVQSTQTQSQETEQMPTLDTNSEDFAANLVNIINQSIEKKFSQFEEKLKPLNSDIAKVNERLTLTDLVAKYGDDFVKKYPAILEYKASDPNVNVEKLYLAMTKVAPKQSDSTSQATNGSNNIAQPQVDLLKKAEQMETVRNGNPNPLVGERPNARMTIQQAVEKAISELFT